MSTLSPNEYGNGGPPAIADATADLRKSIEEESRMTRFGSVRKTAGGGVWEEGGLAVLAPDYARADQVQDVERSASKCR